MKRCPECGRNYNDDSMSFCLDDGSELLFGPASMDEPATAILHSTAAPGEAPTRAQIHTTDQTAILSTGAEAEPQKNLSDSTDKQSFSANRAAKPLAVLVAAVVILVGGFLGYRHFSPTKQIESIAVMPFVNESGNADVEYLSDGMTETLISSLSQLPNLNVKPRSSVFRYKGKDTNPQTIGKELNVQAILNGRVVQRGQDLSLFVELIDVALDKVVWSQQYNRKQSDLVTLQTEITRDVSNKLKTKLSSAEEAKVTKTYTNNPQAYQLYLTGKYHQNKLNEEGYKRSIEYYNQALALDPNYALAYAGIGGAYVNAAEWYLPTREAMPKVKIAAQKALELDESLADAHALMSTYENWYGWDWATGEKEAKRAIELDPNTGHGAYAWHLSINGRNDEAIKEMEIEQGVNPLNLGTKSDLVGLYLRGGQTDKAIDQARKIIELDQNYAIGHEVLGVALARKQMYPEAVVSCEKARSMDNSAELIGVCGYVFAVAGKKTEALKTIDELKVSFSKDLAPAYFIAMVYAGLGEKEKAFEWLEKGFKNRSTAGLKVDIPFEPLRDDPRFKDLLKRMNLPE